MFVYLEWLIGRIHRKRYGKYSALVDLGRVSVSGIRPIYANTSTVITLW